MLRRIEAALGDKALRAAYRPGEPPPRDDPDAADLPGVAFRAGDRHRPRGHRRSPPTQPATSPPSAKPRMPATASSSTSTITTGKRRWEQVPGWARRFARACIEAGASAYVSHGVPLLQGIELHQGRPILHGLGNFIFQTRYGATSWALDESWKSVVATLHYDGPDLARIESRRSCSAARPPSPPAISPTATCRISPGRDGPAILERLAARSAALGTSLTIEGNIGVIRP